MRRKPNEHDYTERKAAERFAVVALVYAAEATAALAEMTRVV